MPISEVAKEALTKRIEDDDFSGLSCAVGVLRRLTPAGFGKVNALGSPDLIGSVDRVERLLKPLYISSNSREASLAVSDRYVLTSPSKVVFRRVLVTEVLRRRIYANTPS